jgi:FAD/FMN-containing dehydrogenase
MRFAFTIGTCPRALYSTDASVYQIEPLGVVVPRSPKRSLARWRFAAELRGTPSRAGGGTSQAGQSDWARLVLDTSKHLNGFLAIDAEQTAGPRATRRRSSTS